MTACILWCPWTCIFINSVLGSYGCWNKLAQTWWFKIAHIYSLRFLQRSEISFIGQHQRGGLALLPPEAVGENPFPCIFQLLELHSLYSLVLAPFSIVKASSFSGHIAFCFCSQISFASILWGHLWLHLRPTLRIQDNLASRNP